MSLFSTLLDILFPREKTEAEILSLTTQDVHQLLTPQTVGTVHTFFRYSNPVIKKMVWMLKYKGERYVTNLFADILADVILEDIADSTLFDGTSGVVIIPLPLSKVRQRERGFNQMEMIGTLLSKKLMVPIDTTLLIKNRYTPPQTTLSRSERLHNIEGAFSVTRTPKGDVLYIILDDVITTGSTLAEAEKTLRASGARNVISVALAH
jgi:ComF family protein